MVYNTVLGVFVIFLSTAFGLGVDNYTTCSCGRRNAPHLETRPSIRGGTEALPGEWPYAVLIRNIMGNTVGQCGGTIITKRHVLSAAHCLQDQGRVFIYYNVDRASGPNPTIPAEKVYIHENFNWLALDRNDIVLILTAGEFPFNRMIGPACFATSRAPDEAPVVAIGWGITGSNSNTDKLQMVELATKNIYQCIDPTNTKTYICTETIGKSICAGDSGGPLLYYDSQVQSYFLVGIVSLALGFGCPNDVSDRYTDVSYYKNWVIDKIKQDTNLHLCTR